MLEVSGLNADYAGVQALWDVSFEVADGSIVALVGGNGAGKTTSLRAISGLVHIGEGTIQGLGKSFTELSPHEIVKAGVAHVPEGRELFPEMTVAENLELGAYLPAARKELGDSFAYVFELFPILAERRRQIASTLSGGEQQMLAIGRALMLRPKLLMLDEPSLGLAPRIVSQIFEKIQEINQEGVTILLVEQNLSQALALADRAYVLENGRVGLQGPAAEIAEHPYVREAYLGI